MAKAAAQTNSRGSKLTQAQVEARAQQRSEDDELIREAAAWIKRTAFDAPVRRRYDQSVLRAGSAYGLGMSRMRRDVHQEAFIISYTAAPGELQV